MWNRKSTPRAPKKKKLVKTRQNCIFRKTRLRLKYSVNGETSSREHDAVTMIAPATYERVMGGVAPHLPYETISLAFSEVDADRDGEAVHQSS